MLRANKMIGALRNCIFSRVGAIHEHAHTKAGALR
jgi:hypothetical protein